MSDEIIEKITKIEEGKDESSIQKKTVPNRDHFESLMQQSTDTSKIKVQEGAETDTAKQSTLMDEVRNSNHSTYYGQVSPEGLVAQTQSVIAQIENIKQSLSTPNLDLKGSVQTLLKSKLEHVDENLKVALEKMGTSEYQAPPQLSGLGNPLERFVGYLTHSQYNLDRISNDINEIGKNGKEMSPASMMVVQMKVFYIQQELEFFTNLLNKALESTKTIMNVQV